MSDFSSILFFSQYCLNLIIINIINYLNLISITSSSGIALSSWSWASTSNNNRNIDIQLPVRRWGASSLGEGPFFLGWRWPWMASQGWLALRELGTAAIGWTVVKAPCVIDLGPPHGEERLLSFGLGGSHRARWRSWQFSFFLSILARSLSWEIISISCGLPHIRSGLEHSLPLGELGKEMSTAGQRPARDTLSDLEAGLNSRT